MHAPEPTEADVNAAYPLWRTWTGVNGLRHAARREGPPLTVRGEDWLDLSDEIKRAEALLAEREHELADLRWHWDGAYEFSWSDGMYRAVRADREGAVNAVSAAGLRHAVIADYRRKPVPRDLPHEYPGHSATAERAAVEGFGDV